MANSGERLMSGTVGVGCGVEGCGEGVVSDGDGLGLWVPGEALIDELGLAELDAPVQPAATGAVPMAARATGVTRAAPMTHFAAGSMETTLTCTEHSPARSAKWSVSRTPPGG